MCGDVRKKNCGHSIGQEWRALSRERREGELHIVSYYIPFFTPSIFSFVAQWPRHATLFGLEGPHLGERTGNKSEGPVETRKRQEGHSRKSCLVVDLGGW